MQEFGDPIKELKELVDDISARIMKGHLTLPEAELMVRGARERAAMLIPDEMDKFDLIYGSRFSRLIEQFIIQRDHNR